MECITYSPALLEQIAQESPGCPVNKASGENIGTILSSRIEAGKVIAEVKLNRDFDTIEIRIA